ncbi:rod shape-determining protein MreD [Phaeobacter sp. HF9A]|uniref:rod shape-determining protein MreD n=1 Tax=Phaeobacter sp. HF9A TaxID=2721561 RepID=UPI0014315438|nr:rod shape-determining protein MreD [Phaeobacter sp. HF9A]NIZ13639.1 rod shape-determining protein MreD [Phaeobacter sp. HF9A]
MARTTPAGIWFMRAVFVAQALVIVFFLLLPLDTLPRRWSPPDLLFATALAWSLRRPDFVPPLLIALVMFFADLMLQRPPGLWALLVLLACEFLKSRMPASRETPFLGEWSAVAVVIIGAGLLNRVILSVLAVEQGHIALVLLQIIVTIVTYPIVVALSQSLFGVRRLSPADAESLGARH